MRTIFISLAALLVSLSSVLAQDVRLRYQIELLSNAKSAVPTPPGAAGTERSFLLTCEKGDWSRLNWPLFRPIDSLRELVFQARAEQDSPSTFQVRLRTQDGIEWQSSAIALTPAWQEHRLAADSFTYFRGDDARRGDRPDFSEVMQFQIVPASAGQGMGSFRVDEIRFLPDGPSYSADDAELVEPLAPREAERQRVEDLLGRWQFELNRLARDSRQARDWLAELRLVARSDTAALRRLANHSSPWHRTLPPVEKSTLALSPAAFDRIVAGFGDRPAPVVDLTAPGTRPYESMLYNAPTPPAPERVVEGGRSILRQVIHFEPSQARQTVFLNVDLPESIDVRGHVLEVDVKFPAVPLNKEFPFLVRLWAMWPDGRDSWADFPPDVLPNGEWQTLRFSTSAPLRSVRFQPDAIRRISFRLENQPGTGGRFPLEVGQARLGWPPAEEIARDELLNRKLDAVHDARRELYALRDQIAAAEDELSPALRRRYLSSFAPVSAPNTVAVRVMDEAQRAAAALAERRFEWGYQPDPTGVALHASLVNGQASERLLVEFYDGKTLVASATGAGSETVAIPVPPAQCWSNRRPRVCTLELAAISGGKVVARSTHSVQPGVVTVAPSPASPVLRQLRQRRQPDWSLRENGRAWFPRMACYNWISLERTVREGHRLLDDLWVDGLRRYGMSTQPGTWDAQDELGVPFLHSLAPNYRSLTGWQDVPMFRSHYSTVYGLLADNANRPFQAVVQSGNEVELSIWGATLPDAFPGALYQPLDMGTELLQDLYARRSPVMYVRAGSFRSVPPLPHEDISGINQYTGRYSGRQDEVARNLAELAREAAFYDRPLMITEWMGPKYSWATGGIGGVTRRGAAYYLERYWRAMLQTPGIAGSSEFTMNWVVAPFEDLTTQTREEAYKNRPKHSKFGGGHTADHVPLVGPDEIVQGPCFRSMQGFHSPLYVVANSPGLMVIVASPKAQPAATRIAENLRLLGKNVQVTGPADTAALAGPVHELFLLHPDDKIVAKLPIDDGDLATDGIDEPLIRQRLRPDRPEALQVVLSAPSAEAFERGAQRLVGAAEALVELRRAEGAMSRVLVLRDKDLRNAYESYLLEFAARGYVFTGNDTCETLDPAELFAADGTRQVAWEQLSALILDTERGLSLAEWQVVETLIGQGVHIIASLPCWQANPELRKMMPATVGDAHSMGEIFPITDALRQPIPVRHLGGADLAAIRRFQPKLADSLALRLHELASTTGEALARTEDGKPVALAWAHGKARAVLIGCPIGEAVEIHRRVARSGETHSLYDRDTACGLERLSRFVVNCCRLAQPEERLLPSLYATVVPASTLVAEGQPVRATVRLTDVEGKPVAGGQLRVRCRRVIDGRAGQTTDYLDLAEASPGVYELVCPPRSANGKGLQYPPPSTDGRLHVVSFQFRAFAPDHIPLDAALAVALDTGRKVRARP